MKRRERERQERQERAEKVALALVEAECQGRRLVMEGRAKRRDSQTWVIVFDEPDSTMDPNFVVVVVDDSTTEARFFPVM
jgi:predicted kinase